MTVIANHREWVMLIFIIIVMHRAIESVYLYLTTKNED